MISMGKKNKRKQPKSPKVPLIFKLYKDKISTVRKLEKNYWDGIAKKREYLNQISPETNHKLESFFPSNISSRIYACLDGIFLMRYVIPNQSSKFEIHYFNGKIDDFSNHLIVPTSDGDVILPFLKIGIGSAMRFIDCSFNNVYIDWLWINSFLYSDDPKLLRIEEAITDFKLYLLGLNIIPKLEPLQNRTAESENILKELDHMIGEFEKLLEDAENEEVIQKYLNENTFIIQAYSEKISKQKLGEDWITDFVLVNMLDQGPRYTFVEIEKPSMPILTKGNEFTKEFKHAEKQILDWDIWLQDNQDYLQRKLTKFEMPNYLIIGGRSKNINDIGKRYIRAWNRSQKNTIFWTYDDLLEKNKELLSSLKRHITA